MRALSLCTSMHFRSKLVRHVRAQFLQECERLGPERVQATVTYGLERAEHYDILTERDICKYINLMFVFGHDFDESGRCAWAAPILNYKDPKGFVPKVDLLVEKAGDHAGDAIGILRSYGLE